MRALTIDVLWCELRAIERRFQADAAKGRLKMITETRQITFSPDALIEALVSHFRSKRQKLPEGTITSVQIEDGPSITVALLIEATGAEKPQRIIVRPEVVGAAMITHCRLRKIPVPRHGVKSLIVSGDSIGLVISTGGKPTALFEVAKD